MTGGAPLGPPPERINRHHRPPAKSPPADQPDAGLPQGGTCGGPGRAPKANGIAATARHHECERSQRRRCGLLSRFADVGWRACSGHTSVICQISAKDPAPRCRYCPRYDDRPAKRLPPGYSFDHHDHEGEQPRCTSSMTTRCGATSWRMPWRGGFAVEDSTAPSLLAAFHRAGPHARPDAAHRRLTRRERLRPVPPAAETGALRDTPVLR